MSKPCIDGPVPPRRRHGAPKNWRRTFLDALAETSNVSAAAEHAEISLSWVYKTRRDDSEFARGWQTALCEGYDNLEMDLLFRLRSGQSKDTEGNKFEFATALRLLHQHRSAVARERAMRDNCDEQAVLDSIDQMIDEMRERSVANAALLIEHLSGDAESGDDDES